MDRIIGAKRRKLVLEVTYTCNTFCPYCDVNSYLPTGESYKDFIDSDTGRRVIDQAVILGLNYVLFTGGEPTLNPNLPDLVKYANSNGMETRINTNGWKSDLHYWESLRDKGLNYAAVSVDLSHNHPVLNEKPIPLERALETIKMLIQTGIETIVPMTAIRDLRNYELAIIYDSVKDVFRELGEITEDKTPISTELFLDGKRHFTTLNRYLVYDGRTGNFCDESITYTKCPSKVDLVDTFFVRVNPYHEIRVPCASDQQLKIKPDLFDPEDDESLMKGIRRLESNLRFLEFLEDGIELKEQDICDFCIEEYLNRK